jgi:L-ascorbate metabolism protein UlaG (beta-lactamase superfamily)
MKITKQGHACLIFEKEGQTLVLDPGSYTKSLAGMTNVVAVVITHAHDDHCFEPQLNRLLELNPDLMIFGPPQVCTRLANYKTTAVYHGDYYPVGPFTVEFMGDLHAEVHRSIPVIENRAVLVNNKVFYPGDSFTLPDREVELLAVPTSAPWLKIGEVMDFVAGVKHKQSIATHNALNSEFGHTLNNGRVKQVTEAQGGTFKFLEDGESLEI